MFHPPPPQGASTSIAAPQVCSSIVGIMWFPTTLENCQNVGNGKPRYTERGAGQEGCTVPKGKQKLCNALIEWTDCKSLQSRRVKAGRIGIVSKWVSTLLLVALECRLLVAGCPMRQASCCASMAGGSVLHWVGSGQPKAVSDATVRYKIKQFRCFAQLCLSRRRLGCWGREGKDVCAT